MSEQTQNGATAAVERAKARTTEIVKKGTFAGAKSGDIASVLKGYEAQIAQALPKAAGDLNAQRIIQIAASIIGRDDNLKKCDIGSVVGAVMQAAILGLNPLPQLAEAFFIPYGNQCQFQIGYRGLINIYHRGRIIRNVYAAVVCEGDEFEYQLGIEQVVRHVPKVDPKPDGANITHAYAIAYYLNGAVVPIVLTRNRIEQLRARGGGKGPAWKSDYAAMAMAKALKQLKRFIPSDASIDAAMATDEQVLKPEYFRRDQSGAIDLEKIESADDLADVLESKAIPANGVAHHDEPTDTRRPSEVATDSEGRIL